MEEEEADRLHHEEEERLRLEQEELDRLAAEEEEIQAQPKKPKGTTKPEEVGAIALTHFNSLLTVIAIIFTM